MLSAGCCASAQSVHEIAQRVDKHYNQLHSLRAQFAESYQGLGITRTESGTLLLEKPGRMRWDYAVPAGKIFLLDGKYAWFYTRGDAQVQRAPAKQLDDLRSPLRFLLGHTQLEKEMTNLSVAALPGGQFRLTGQPKGLEKRVSKIELTVTASGVLMGIVITEADGAVTQFSFTGETVNEAIPGDAFRFVPPAGVPVMDAPPPV